MSDWLDTFPDACARSLHATDMLFAPCGTDTSFDTMCGGVLPLCTPDSRSCYVFPCVDFTKAHTTFAWRILPVRRISLVVDLMTDAISDSSVGLIEVILLPLEEGTNSLLMNRPVGCVYFNPLGAVSSTERSDMVATNRMFLILGTAVERNGDLSVLEKRAREREVICRKRIRPTSA